MNKLDVLRRRQAEERDALYKAHNCEHQNAEIRARQIRGGSTQYVKQCTRCGEVVGNAVPKAEAMLHDIKPFNASLRDAERERRDREREDLRARHSGERSDIYGSYLASPLWRAKREKVMQRDGGLCQGCRERQASDVHHLTYERWGNEMLFDLVAVCRDCHEQIHADEDA